MDDSLLPVTSLRKNLTQAHLDFSYFRTTEQKLLRLCARSHSQTYNTPFGRAIYFINKSSFGGQVHGIINSYQQAWILLKQISIEMESKMNNKYTVGIITASDKGSKGEREDISGKRIREILPSEKYEIISYRVLPDGQKELEQEMIRLADECKCSLILTTGGTGFSLRDVTPEATLAVCDRNAPGIAEAIRAYSMTITKRAMLSRGASAIRGQSLIVNLPGSPKAVEESLTYILDSLEHGMDILLGRDGECARRG